MENCNQELNTRNSEHVNSNKHLQRIEHELANFKNKYDNEQKFLKAEINRQSENNKLLFGHMKNIQQKIIKHEETITANQDTITANQQIIMQWMMNPTQAQRKKKTIEKYCLIPSCKNISNSLLCEVHFNYFTKREAKKCIYFSKFIKDISSYKNSNISHKKFFIKFACRNEIRFGHLRNKTFIFKWDSNKNEILYKFYQEFYKNFRQCRKNLNTKDFIEILENNTVSC